MSVIITLIFSVISIGVISIALLRPSLRTIFLATMLLFAFGHYQIPIYFIDRTSLRDASPNELNAVLLLNLLFMVTLILGFSATCLFSKPEKELRNNVSLVSINSIITKYRFLFGPACAVIYLMYLIFFETTSYTAADFEDFFLIRSAGTGIISFVANFALAGASVALVLAVRKREWWLLAFLVATFISILFVSLGRGQRLIFLTPIFTILAAFAAQQQYRMTGFTLLGGLLALLLVSPFAVTLRETIASDAMRQTDEVDSSFSYGSDPVSTILQSLLDRADIIENAISLKSYSDDTGPVSWAYFHSVLVAPIPRSLYPEKPVPLSNDGTIFSEPSVIAWQLKKGETIGSLTSFGAIVAYREGGAGWGWPWALVNGFLTGIIMASLLGLFARSGLVGHMFLCMAFVAWSVAKVPPSLFEMLAGLLAWLPIAMLIILADTCTKATLHHSSKPTFQTQ